MMEEPLSQEAKSSVGFRRVLVVGVGILVVLLYAASWILAETLNSRIAHLSLDAFAALIIDYIQRARQAQKDE